MLFKGQLIHDVQICTFCDVDMKFKASNGRTDKFEWRCTNFYCTKYQTFANIRDSSMFANFKIEFQLILEAIYYISVDLQSFKILQLTEIKKKS